MCLCLMLHGMAHTAELRRCRCLVHEHTAADGEQSHEKRTDDTAQRMLLCILLQIHVSFLPSIISANLDFRATSFAPIFRLCCCQEAADSNENTGKPKDGDAGLCTDRGRNRKRRFLCLGGQDLYPDVTFICRYTREANTELAVHHLDRLGCPARLRRKDRGGCIVDLLAVRQRNLRRDESLAAALRLEREGFVTIGIVVYPHNGLAAMKDQLGAPP